MRYSVLSYFKAAAARLRIPPIKTSAQTRSSRHSLPLHSTGLSVGQRCGSTMGGNSRTCDRLFGRFSAMACEPFPVFLTKVKMFLHRKGPIYNTCQMLVPRVFILLIFQLCRTSLGKHILTANERRRDSLFQVALF